MTTGIGCFISPHGFGHAARTIAVLGELHEVIPDLRATFLTTVPENLFASCPFPFTHHRITTDVGLVQSSALSSELQQTVKCLARFIPVQQEVIGLCADICRDCRLILCDISILGILVGAELGRPSVLIENFTWDWIYADLVRDEPALLPYADYFRESYARTDYRIQTEPLCHLSAADLICPPIARRTIQTPSAIAESLDKKGRRLVLVTMGGIPLELPFLDQLSQHPEYLFVLAGQQEAVRPADNVVQLSLNTRFHHPDLIQAADLLVCKSGYSTIAECSQANTPICCVKRSGFAESAVLENWITTRMNGTLLEPDEFFSGSWLERLPALLARTRSPETENGAHQAATFISSLLKS